MQGAWRSNRNDSSTGRLLYRCTLRGARAVPAELQDHPRSLYVREDAIIPALDAWIAELTDPKVLTAAAIDPPLDPANEALRHHVSELDR